MIKISYLHKCLTVFPFKNMRFLFNRMQWITRDVPYSKNRVKLTIESCTYFKLGFITVELIIFCQIPQMFAYLHTLISISAVMLHCERQQRCHWNRIPTDMSSAALSNSSSRIRDLRGFGEQLCTLRATAEQPPRPRFSKTSVSLCAGVGGTVLTRGRGGRAKKCVRLRNWMHFHSPFTSRQTTTMEANNVRKGTRGRKQLRLLPCECLLNSAGTVEEGQ